MLMREQSGQSRAGSIAPSCLLGWPITAQKLVHLARSRSLSYNIAFLTVTQEKRRAACPRSVK